MAPGSKVALDDVINIKVPKVTKKMLAQLAISENRTMSQICRELIDLRHRQVFSNEPRCASGGHCLCPQMHRVNSAGNDDPEQRVNAVQKNHNEAAV